MSDKTVSKWETARSLPDITLLEPPAAWATGSCTGTATGTDYLSKRYNKSERPRRLLAFILWPRAGYARPLHTVFFYASATATRYL